MKIKKERNLGASGLVDKMNKIKKTPLKYFLVKTAEMFDGYEFIVADEHGNVISRTNLPFVALISDDYSVIIKEFKKAEKLYNMKLFKALK